MKKKPKAYTRSKRKEQVILQLRLWRENGYATEATSYKLARSLEIEPTQRFRDMLNEMVAEGDLVFDERAKFGRFDTKFYALSESRMLSRVVLKRRVNVKCKGVVSAQLEMWS